MELRHGGDAQPGRAASSIHFPGRMGNGFERELLEGDHDRYELGLLPRFAHVVERLLAVLPDGPRRDRLVRTMGVVDVIPAGALLAAAHQPELDAWVKTGERSLALGIARAYPDARAALLVHALELLLVSWTEAVPEGTTSTFRVHGRSRVALGFGATQLIPDPWTAPTEVRWRRLADALELRAEDDHGAVVVPLGSRPTTADRVGAWTLTATPVTHGVRLDLRCASPSSTSACARDRARDEPALTWLVGAVEAARQLGTALELARPLGRLRVITTGDELGWVAGHAALSSSTSDPGEVLHRRVLADLIERGMATGRHPPAESTTRLGRARAVAKEVARVRALAAADDPSSSRAARRWLSSLASRWEASVVPARLPSAAELAEPDASLTPLALDAVPALASIVRLDPRARSHRRTSRDRGVVSRFDLLDALTFIDADILRSSLAALDRFPLRHEDEALAAASLRYVLGDFRGCIDALSICRRHAPQVQEYSDLLAFSYRHLGDEARFDALIFETEAEEVGDAVAAPEPRPSATTTSPPEHEFRGIFGELVQLRENDRQISQYMGLVAGVRRSVDDWIAPERFAAFRRLATRLGLVVRTDCVFLPLGDLAPDGLELTPTTRARAVRFDPRSVYPGGARIHVFVSSRADWADETFAAGWYSVAPGNRIVGKPPVDHVRLGRAFGYPQCCVDFFLRRGDLERKNLIAEAVAKSHALHWEANCLAKSTPWTLLFHMPCAFDCAATLHYTRGILRAATEIDPEYAAKIERNLRRVVVSLNLRVAIALEGATVHHASHVSYRAATNLREKSTLGGEARHAETIARGDELRIEDGVVHVLRSGVLVDVLEPYVDPDVVDVPLVLDFS